MVQTITSCQVFKYFYSIILASLVVVVGSYRERNVQQRNDDNKTTRSISHLKQLNFSFLFRVFKFCVCVSCHQQRTSAITLFAKTIPIRQTHSCLDFSEATEKTSSIISEAGTERRKEEATWLHSHNMHSQHSHRRTNYFVSAQVAFPLFFPCVVSLLCKLGRYFPESGCCFSTLLSFLCTLCGRDIQPT